MSKQSRPTIDRVTGGGVVLSDTSTFPAWLTEAIADAPQTSSGVSLIGYDQLCFQEASAAPLIRVFAEIIATTCRYSPADTPQTLPLAA